MSASARDVLTAASWASFHVAARDVVLAGKDAAVVTVVGDAPFAFSRISLVAPPNAAQHGRGEIVGTVLGTLYLLRPYAGHLAAVVSDHLAGPLRAVCVQLDLF